MNTVTTHRDLRVGDACHWAVKSEWMINISWVMLNPSPAVWPVAMVMDPVLLGWRGSMEGGGGGGGGSIGVLLSLCASWFTFMRQFLESRSLNQKLCSSPAVDINVSLKNFISFFIPCFFKFPTNSHISINNVCTLCRFLCIVVCFLTVHSCDCFRTKPVPDDQIDIYRNIEEASRRSVWAWVFYKHECVCLCVCVCVRDRPGSPA